MTRRKTFSGGSHATFNRGCHNELHDLAIRPGRQRLVQRDAMLAVQRKAAALGVELPEAIRVGRDLQDVAGMPAGHVENV